MEKVIWKKPKEIKTCPFGDFLNKMLHNSHDPQHMQLLNNDDVNGVDVNWPEFQDSRAKQLKQQSAGKWEQYSTAGKWERPSTASLSSAATPICKFSQNNLCGKEQEYELYCFPHS